MTYVELFLKCLSALFNKLQVFGQKALPKLLVFISNVWRCAEIIPAASLTAIRGM